ncbi:MAG: YkgJ family cysteine cluster protein [Ignavibacteriaceae bacterium]
MDSDNIELDIQKIEELGKLREKENLRFRIYLKGKDSNRIDKIVHRLNLEISGKIDCTKCGNCCKKISPSLNEKEIVRISERINFSPEAVKEKYIEISDGEQFFKDRPCNFLHENKCSIYTDRPGDCREYPFLHKKFFISRLIGVIENYSICPIVFNVFERLKTELRFK